MEAVRIVGYVLLGGVAPVALLCFVMLRGVLPRRTPRAAVIELRPTQPSSAGRSPGTEAADARHVSGL